MQAPPPVQVFEISFHLLHFSLAQITDFNFRYNENLDYVLKDVNITVEKGSRVLVLGYTIVNSESTGFCPARLPFLILSANGAGKSTLFRILAGKHMHERRQVLVMGRSAFFETPREMSYLGSDWRHSISCVR